MNYSNQEDHIKLSEIRSITNVCQNDNSSSKQKSNIKSYQLKNKIFEEDEKNNINEHSAKTNFIGNFQNMNKNSSIFNIGEMSPTVNNYNNNLLLSNLDENKLKYCETPQKFSNLHNDNIWFENTHMKQNILSDSPLFPRNLQHKLNRNYEITSSFKKINYFYEAPKITKKNLCFVSENNLQDNSFYENFSQNHTNYCNVSDNYTKKLFLNYSNKNANSFKFANEKIPSKNDILMSSDDDLRNKIKSVTNSSINFKSRNILGKSNINTKNSKENSVDKKLENKNPSYNNTRSEIRELSNRKLKALKFKLKSQKKTTSFVKQNHQENLNKKNIKKIDKYMNGEIQMSKCTCSKTQCLKKYCECFSSGKLCIDCECENCMNTPQNAENIISLKNEISLGEEEDSKSNQIVCNCTKSGCLKKYCECFKAGKKCSEECRCINCDNFQSCRNHRKYSKKNSRNKFSHNHKKNSLKNDVNFNTEIDESEINYKIIGKFDESKFQIYNVNVFIRGETINIVTSIKKNALTKNKFKAAVQKKKKIKKNKKKNPKIRPIDRNHHVEEKNKKLNKKKNNLSNIEEKISKSNINNLYNNTGSIFRRSNRLRNEKENDWSLLQNEDFILKSNGRKEIDRKNEISVSELHNYKKISENCENYAESNSIDLTLKDQDIKFEIEIINKSSKKENKNVLKCMETPKLCERKRNRNTTSSKARILNEDVYINTNSTMNQTPILYNDNIKKRYDLDRKIVKNLQSDY